MSDKETEAIQTARKKLAPSTLGEWDEEIKTRSTKQLEVAQAALRSLREWDAFSDAFRWTLIFVLEQSIGFELGRRAKR